MFALIIVYVMCCRDEMAGVASSQSMVTKALWSGNGLVWCVINVFYGGESVLSTNLLTNINKTKNNLAKL